MSFTDIPTFFATQAASQWPNWYNEADAQSQKQLLNEEIPPTEAAEALFQTASKQLAARLSNEHGFILEAASELPDSHDILIAYYNALKSLVKDKPPIPAEDDKTLTFGALWRDRHDSLKAYRDPTAGSRSRLMPSSGYNFGFVPEDAKWQNFNAFSAKIWAQDPGPSNVDVESIWPLLALVEALERVPQTPEAIAENKFSLVPLSTVSVNVVAAAQWVCIAGKQISRLRNEDVGESWKGALKTKGELWEGKEGYCQERWSFWIERFRVVSKLNGISEDGTSWAEKAIRKMEQVTS